MARDRTARTRIRTLLVNHGPIEDQSGHATGVLKDAIGYEGSSVAFIQLIAAMDRDGEIIRDIRGKRTFRISAAADLEQVVGFPLIAPPTGAASVTRAPEVRTGAVVTHDGAVSIDYDKLARALVRELFAFVTARPGSADGVFPELDAERARMDAERDEYARRLELANAKLDELLGTTDRTATGVTA